VFISPVDSLPLVSPVLSYLFCLVCFILSDFCWSILLADFCPRVFTGVIPRRANAVRPYKNLGQYTPGGLGLVVDFLPLVSWVVRGKRGGVVKTWRTDENGHPRRGELCSPVLFSLPLNFPRRFSPIDFLSLVFIHSS